MSLEMAKLLLASTCLILIAGQALAAAHSDWEQFKRQHGKSYASPLEDEMRRSIFSRNKREVEQFNAEQGAQLGYERGLNHLSDLTRDEMEHMLGVRVPANFNRTNSAESSAFFARLMAAGPEDIPASVDWRKKKGIVTPVKDMGYECDSSYAFSVVAMLEGQELAHSSQTKLIDLSEQNLIDCSVRDNGCKGGWPVHTIDSIIEQGGIQSGPSYAFFGREQKCRFQREKAVLKVVGHYTLEPNNEDLLKRVVARYGPVSVCMDVIHDSFRNYQKGVYKEEDCKKDQPNHCLAIVGYGTDPKEGDYWIVRNSWTTDWGDEGYIKVARGRNTCGIAWNPVIATF